MTHHNYAVFSSRKVRYKGLNDFFLSIKKENILKKRVENIVKNKKF